MSGIEVFLEILAMTSPVIFFTLLMGMIGSWQVFTAGYVMTGGDRPIAPCSMCCTSTAMAGSTSRWVMLRRLPGSCASSYCS
jgi:ABC-type sugar transport system permease subunit